jgi:GNAT superfamily N-acetyltransferase
MESLAYAVTPLSTQKYVELSSVSEPVVSHSTWQELADKIAKEESLTSYPRAVLARRWEQGYAALALHNEEIVSYTSVVPLFFDKTRRRLSRELDVDEVHLPNTDLYEFASGWTDPAWRRKGISLQLRRNLLGRLDMPRCLIASISVGLGASYVLEKLGWQIAGWGKIPYLTSLIGIPTAGLEGKIDQKMGWSLPSELERYEGQPISPSQNPDHAWADFCHFWISSLPLAQKTDQQISTLLNDNLRRWREAVLEIMAIPAQLGWEPILFDK